MSFSPTQCRAARAILSWSQADLAYESKVATKTIADYERGDRTPYERTIADIRAALEAAGVQFSNGDHPGVRLDLHGMRGRSAQLRARIDHALTLVDRSVSSKVESIRAEFFKSHEEPQSLLESFNRLRRQKQILEAAGVEFTNGDQPGVRLRKRL